MEQNGLITSYTLIYYAENFPSNKTFRMYPEENTTFIQNLTTIYNLEVFAVYHIHIFASTIVGPGPKMSLQQRTNEGGKFHYCVYL